MRVVSDALNLNRYAAVEAVQFQIDMMRGLVVLKGLDGEEDVTVRLSTEEIQQMRLASNSILNRAGVVYDGPAGSEEDGSVEIVGIRILDQMERD
jgi:hypothetical protein